MMNPYNKKIFVRHRANMDIQYVIDPYGCAAYISSYMLKSNATMSRLLKNAVDEVVNDNQSTVRQRLVRVANKFNNCAEISAQECSYTVMGMNFCRFSRSIGFLNTNPSNLRTRMIMEERWLRLMDPDSTSIYRLGVLEHYKNRPNTMNDVCLAEFAAYYDFVSKESARMSRNPNRLNRFVEDDDEIDDDGRDEHYEEEAELGDNESVTSTSQVNINENSNRSQNETNRNCSKLIKLKNGDGYVKRRLKAKILRYKRYNRIKDESNFFRVQLMLYMPWRNEEREVEIEDTFEKFNRNQQVIIRNRQMFENVEAENYERAQEEVEREIQEHYERLIEDEVDRI